MGQLSERIELRISENLDKFLEKERRSLEKELGEHVTTAEVVRRLLNVVMYLKMSPQADLGKIVQHAAEFEEFVQEEYGAEELE